ncbi:uncharacterized protein LOC120290780 [Eucalyptus grandis]|uniref:uncharacterized protein LOC120290780 n=1 Tax=Eucalyptus grandis TaxID=71139 RepID=UPI00192E9BB8|nr:uncharacterized protein LOC120290780 [Eucalyptus grandis]
MGIVRERKIIDGGSGSNGVGRSSRRWAVQQVSGAGGRKLERCSAASTPGTGVLPQANGRWNRGGGAATAWDLLASRVAGSTGYRQGEWAGGSGAAGEADAEAPQKRNRGGAGASLALLATDERAGVNGRRSSAAAGRRWRRTNEQGGLGDAAEAR